MYDKKLSKDIMNKFTEFMICEIGSKSLDGINFAIFDELDSACIDNYSRIRKELTSKGYPENVLFIEDEFSNGRAYVLDKGVLEKITKELLRVTNKANEGRVNYLLKDLARNRKKEDMFLLAKKLNYELTKGNNKVEVIIYNQTNKNNIFINAKTKSGTNVVIKYDAYSVTREDLELLNKEILIRKGFRIFKTSKGEVLPGKEGVRLEVLLEKV